MQPNQESRDNDLHINALMDLGAARKESDAQNFKLGLEEKLGPNDNHPEMNKIAY